MLEGLATTSCLRLSTDLSQVILPEEVESHPEAVQAALRDPQALAGCGSATARH